MTKRSFNAPVATSEEIPEGLEKDQSYNRPSTMDIAIGGSGAYVAGEIVGGLQTVFDETIARNYDGVNIRLLNLTDKDNQQKSFTLHFFNKKPTNFNDKDDFLTSAVAADILARKRSIVINSGLWSSANGIAYLDIVNVDLDLDLRAGEKGPFYFILVADSAYTAANGITVSSTFWVA